LPMCYSRSMASPKRWPASRCVWPPLNCRFAHALSPDATDFRHAMNKTKRKELQENTMPELLADGRNLRQEICNLRLQQASAQLEKPGRLRTLRRDIARIETRISQIRNQAA